MITPHELIVIDGYEFTSVSLNSFLKRDRVYDRVSLLCNCKNFSELTDEKIRQYNPRFIAFNYWGCAFNLVKHLEHLKKLFPKIIPVCYFFLGSEFELNILLREGVRAILGWHDAPGVLLEALDELETEEYFMNENITSERIQKANRAYYLHENLSINEVVLMKLLSMGLSREMCSRHLHRELSTLSNDITSIHHKTHTETDMQITRYGLLHGYITPELISLSARMDTINLEGNYTYLEDED